MKKYQGFTIVELLIVIVVIGILAALVLNSFNGAQNKAKQSSVLSDLRSNSSKIDQYMAINDLAPTPAQVQQDESAKLRLSGGGVYKVAAYCSAGDQYAIAAEITTGDKYYIQKGNQSIQDNTINPINICATLGIVKSDGSAADTTYLGMSSSPCAAEGGGCTIAGVKSVAYGANGKFNIKANASGTISCNNTTFGDPISGVRKSCYTLEY
jgi:prepilin-type N-terminal cleavage/methylation domain-containing protein